MLIIKFVFLGILIHELLSFSIDGVTYFSDNIAPVFNLRLKRSAKVVVHILLISASLVVLFFPISTHLIVVVFIIYTVYLLSYSTRLSNHLCLAWFIMSFYLLANSLNEFYLLTQYALILTYFFSGLHKLNKFFFHPYLSCLARIIAVYFQEKKIDQQKLAFILFRYGAYIVVIIELGLPLLLYFPETNKFGFFIAIIMHFVFGLIIHVHFSIIMLGLVLSFLSSTTYVSFDFILEHKVLLIIMSIILSVFAYQFGQFEKTKYKNLTRVIFAFFGLVTAFVLLLVIESKDSIPPNVISVSNPIYIAILGLFILNGMSPYIGFKTNYSFSMFSNLRPDAWHHFVFPNRYSKTIDNHYVTILEMDDKNNMEAERPWLKKHMVKLNQHCSFIFSKHYFFHLIKSLEETKQGTDHFIVKYSYKGTTYTFDIMDTNVKPDDKRIGILAKFPHYLSKDCLKIPCCY